MEVTKTRINRELSLKKANSLKRIVRERFLPDKNWARYFNWGRATKFSKCIGLIGPRGSGKSTGAAAIAALDYMVPGYKVISNMDIRWGVRLGNYAVVYGSEDLNKAALLNFDIEDKICLVIDEVNIEFSEARRSTSNRNLIFNKILQQLRKRSINLIYTTQHEMWVDNRLRFQTDIFIKCQDVCLQPGGINLHYDFGEIINWRIYDMIGLYGRGSYLETQKPLKDDHKFYGKLWWNTFDTSEIQGEDEMSYGKPQYTDIQYKHDQEMERLKEYSWISDEIENICANPVELNKKGEISEPALMHLLNVEPKDVEPVKRYLDKVLGIKCRNSGYLRMYILKYLVEKRSEKILV